MKYISAYALAWLSGKSSPTVKDLENIINSVGGDFDSERAESVIDALAERDLSQVVRSGLPKLQGGGAAVFSSASVVSATNDTKEAETKKDEKKDEKEDEGADFDGALDMFGGDDF